MSEIELLGFRTTFHGMFTTASGDGEPLSSVEIPLIQRDYAQGREEPRADAIRRTFLDALHEAATGGAPVGLDFIYGNVTEGRFEPLDGQQRLTTLFLLHLFVAARRGALSPKEPWMRLSYATRPSARLFCERLVANPLPQDLAVAPSAWVTDQPWYLHVWKLDPTIRAMLVTLDAIAARFADEDAEAVWKRLTDVNDPAIWFQQLPIHGMAAPENLYIKMNSRGKPLTEFEAFKAHLGQLVASFPADEDCSHAGFGHKIDGAWTDLLWPYRGENDVVDDEFMRYFDFLIEVCEWRDGIVRGSEVLTPEQRASRLLAVGNPSRVAHLDFLCRAFSCWEGEPSVKKTFAGLFRTVPTGGGIRLFGASSTNLFHECCEKYGLARGATRVFPLTDTLLLLAVIVHRFHETEDAQLRLRELRNVLEASQFQMRVANMPRFVSEVDAFMRTGDLGRLSTFNQNQVKDEETKRLLRAKSPELADAIAALEDHTILRGSLAVFELDEELPSRARAFQLAFEKDGWQTLTGALLATGEYQRDYTNSDFHRFGSPTTESFWRELLVEQGDRDSLAATRKVLMRLLDDVAQSTLPTHDALQKVIDTFLASRLADSRLDWRYYLVRYPEMREGNSGIYYGAHGRLGYEITMLRKTAQNSWYRDPYLYAMWREAGSPLEVADPWFSGYSTTPRYLVLTKSQVGLRSAPEGIVIRRPADQPEDSSLARVCSRLEAVPYGPDLLLALPQTEWDGELVDAEDRIQRGAKLITTMVASGL